MIRILIVDDSVTETALLKYLFQTEPDLQVIGCARNGKEAIEMTEQLRPDIITMDIHMPQMDGLESIKVIMAQCPTPIVVISSKVNDKELNISFQALEAGALSVLDKPKDVSSSQFEFTKRYILETIRMMAEIKVVRRRFPVTSTKKKNLLISQAEHREFNLLAIGASVGGPQALKKILRELPASFPVPIVVVQHMSAGFLPGFVHWLNENISLSVKCAEPNEILKESTVYFAPDKMHLEIVRVNEKLIGRLNQGEPVSGFCPSITTLFHSVALSCGKQSIGLLLTGMGSDGAEGLLSIKKSGGLSLIQDEKSAVVFGMAGVAQRIGAVEKVVPLDQLADYLKELFVQKKITNNVLQ